MIKFLLRLFGIEVFETPADLEKDKFFSYQLLRHVDAATNKAFFSK